MMSAVTHRRHLPFFIGAAAGLLAVPIVSLIEPVLVVEAAANVFFLFYLVLTAARLPRLTADFLRSNASSEDEPVWVIFLVTLGAVAVAVGSLFVIINAKGPADSMQLGFSLASVALGWLTIHTMTAMHYAHRFWQPQRQTKSPKAANWHGGLDFPETTEPSGFDFLYFAFVIGMTAQTADVGITRTSMRKMVLLHGVVSFFFNTVLVAAAVNLAVSLAGQ